MVNNIMASMFAPVWEITAEEFRRVTDVTYLGVVYGVLAALRRMRARDGGPIVQVGSLLAYRGPPLQSPYCACKYAIQDRRYRIYSYITDDKRHVLRGIVLCGGYDLQASSLSAECDLAPAAHKQEPPESETARELLPS